MDLCILTYWPPTVMGRAAPPLGVTGLRLLLEGSHSFILRGPQAQATSGISNARAT